MTAKHRSAMQPGRQYGQYRIIESLGSGGMGDVYAAEDTELGRRVALKVLPEKMAADPERLRRFEREARVIAALNHPNIVTLHSIERDGETRFLTMELVSGSTLDTLIAPRGLHLGKFFELAIPLVEALVAAHERGITHRDLKPGNIMVTDNSTVKVLDFGLAKLRDSLLAPADSDHMQTELITGSGQIIGTVAYMSPEQAEGKPVDGRSDIFSLGVLFYEMLCGERPFQGDSAVSILSAILHVHPEPITSLRGSLPRQCGRICEMCLQKDPSRRFQSAVDLRNALEALAAEVTGATSVGTLPAAGATAPRRPQPGLLIAAVGLGAALIGAWVGSQLTGSAVSSEPAPIMSRSGWELGPFSRQGDLSDHPTWSPAGDWIAYASDAGGSLDIWKRPAAGGRPIRLTNDDTNALHPTWSPDGRMIAYAVHGDEGGIYLVDAEGGSPFRLTGPGTHPAWSPNGQRLAFDRHGAVVLIDANGRNERELLANTSGTTVPTWAPSGEALYVWHRLTADVQLVSLDGGEPVSLELVPTGEEVTGLTYATASDELLLSRGQWGGHKNLWLAPIDPATGLTAGAATRITDPFTDDRHAAIGPNGDQIAFGARRIERHLWSFPLDPDTGLVSGEPTQLTKEAPQNYYPDLSADGRQLVWTAHQTEQGFLFSRALDGSSNQKITNEWGKSSREVGASFAPDGQRLSFASTQSGSYQIWQIPCLGCVHLPLTTTEYPIRDSLTAWSPDGSTIAFYSNRLENWDIWTVDVERGGEPTQVTRLPGSEVYPVWSPDGRSIAFRSQQEDGNVDLWIVEPGGTPRPWVEEPGEEAWGAWSVDGTRFYYATDRNGSFNIWMRPHEGGTAVPVTAYDSPIRGLPDAALYTKFALGNDRLIVPVETRSGEIWILERPR